jgi:hypothetical protein
MVDLDLPADGIGSSLRSGEVSRVKKRKRFGMAMRKPKKISVTIPQSLYELLLVQSEMQGRSLSSVASYWLQVQASRGESISDLD